MQKKLNLQKKNQKSGVSDKSKNPKTNRNNKSLWTKI